MMDPQALVGQQIGQYRILQYMSRGGMADIYRAEDVGLGRSAVIKVMLPEFLRDAVFVERFRREAKAAARLDHWNIIRIYATDTLPDGRPYIAMEYISEGSLDERITGAREEGVLFAADYALALTRQVADALATAHAAGIVHRDLKPANILMRDGDTPVLTDLGIAYQQSESRLTQTNVVMGTPDYMSPEQASSKPVDARSDIYSLGIILYEMLGSQRPFEGDSTWVILRKHLWEAPPPLEESRPGLAPQTYQVVAKCLEKDPADRYQSAAQLVAALDLALQAEGSGGEVTHSGLWRWRPAETGRRFLRRSGVFPVPPQAVERRQGFPRWLLLVPLLLLLLALAAFFLWPEVRDLALAEEPTATATVEQATATSVATSTAPPDSSSAARLAERQQALAQSKISLLFPQRDDQLTLQDGVPFRWSWPLELLEGEHFVLYIDERRVEGEATPDATASEEYIFETDLANTLSEPGIYQWQVRLQREDDETVLLESFPGILYLMAEATSTPTPTATTHSQVAPATSTPRPTLAPTLTPTQPPPTQPPPTQPPPTQPPPTQPPPPPPTEPPPTQPPPPPTEPPAPPTYTPEANP